MTSSPDTTTPRYHSPSSLLTARSEAPPYVPDLASCILQGTRGLLKSRAPPFDLDSIRPTECDTLQTSRVRLVQLFVLVVLWCCGCAENSIMLTCSSTMPRRQFFCALTTEALSGPKTMLRPAIANPNLTCWLERKALVACTATFSHLAVRLTCWWLAMNLAQQASKQTKADRLAQMDSFFTSSQPPTLACCVEIFPGN
ncbi:uncharacterized protein IWZ02DRAFT_209087 [Phyllosticta citriasiana]|uniref:uncharacterized protein n=1 Tax=Phyllosticta citriasiana TaxID=595635 RepID=UPI0030FDE2B1